MVVNSGVKKHRGKISIVPLKLLSKELVYEKEIQPGIFKYAIGLIKNFNGNIKFIKKAFVVLNGLSFDDKCKKTQTNI